MCLSKNLSLPTPATTVKTIPKGYIFLNNPFQLVYQTLQHRVGEGLSLPHGGTDYYQAASRQVKINHNIDYRSPLPGVG